jgi:hypothetical protein
MPGRPHRGIENGTTSNRGLLSVSEPAYLLSVLLWLQEYWTGPAPRFYPFSSGEHGAHRYPPRGRRPHSIDKMQQSICPSSYRAALDGEDNCHWTECRRIIIICYLQCCDRRTLITAAVWLVDQCRVFTRHREQLAMRRFSSVLMSPAIRARWRRLNDPASSATSSRLPDARRADERRLNARSLDQALVVSRRRIGLRTKNASAATVRFIAAAKTKTQYQLPVIFLMMLASGTTQTATPFAV